MKLKEVTIALGEKINTGNYNNADYHVRGTIEIAEGDDPDESVNTLKDYLYAQAKELRLAITDKSHV